MVGSQGAGPEYLVSGYFSCVGRHKKNELVRQNPEQRLTFHDGNNHPDVNAFAE